MNPSSVAPIRERYDRHVRRAQLLVNAEAPRHRLAYTFEEALRLLSLPGEDQGRTYYFGHLRVTGLPSDGDRHQWLTRFQQTVERQAAQAVHGADPRADQAEVVFFGSQPEALELLLHRLLAGRAASEWFWPMVVGERDGIAPSVVDVLERLHAQPASWVAVAACLFAGQGFDAVGLINAIPRAVIERWLHGMDAPPPEQRIATSAPGSSWLHRPPLRQALQAFGPLHPGVVWLAALAVLSDFPLDLGAGIAVRRAHIGLEQLGLEQLGATLAVPASDRRQNPTKSPRSRTEMPYLKHDRDQPGSASAASPVTSAVDDLMLSETTFTPASSSGQPRSDSSPPGSHPGDPYPPAAHETKAPPWVPSPIPPQRSNPLASRHDPSPGSHALPVPSPWVVLGGETRAGGLFFLLNALLRLGVDQDVSLSLTVPHLTPRVLLNLVRQAGVPEDDPVLAWLIGLTTYSFEDAPLPPPNASCWPAGLGPIHRAVSSEDLVRVWSLSVRRWCWHHAGISAGEVVRRQAVFSVNRIDLDITLPIDEADVRIRKSGLDLDPGWLPWFGRVVRFHYHFRGEFHG